MVLRFCDGLFIFYKPSCNQEKIWEFANKAHVYLNDLKQYQGELWLMNILCHEEMVGGFRDDKNGYLRMKCTQ